MRAAATATLILAAACSPQGEPQPQPDQPTTAGATARPAALDTLVGLYEGPAGAQVNQMCVVRGGAGGGHRFGLVTWGANLHSCSGTGTITRDGDRLRLAMTGDSSCVIDATIAGTRITLPTELPDGCDYYCGARARLSSVTFEQRGTTRNAALRAKDLVGDPLCDDL